MQILVIHGSMRSGNTYALTKEVINRLEAKPDVEITEINVASLSLPFCTSCHACLSNGEEYCPHADITLGMGKAFSDCDGLILSGTTYIRALNAAMKNLMDHFAYYFHRPRLFGKHGMVIATSAGAGEKNVAEYIKNVMGQWGINGAIILTQNTKEKRLQSVKAGLSAKFEKKLDAAAEQFYKRIKSKKQISPTAKNIATHNAFRAMSLSDFSESECDKNYWSKDEFNRAYPVKIGKCKYLIGALVYSMVNKLADIIGRSYKKEAN